MGGRRGFMKWLGVAPVVTVVGPTPERKRVVFSLILSTDVCRCSLTRFQLLSDGKILTQGVLTPGIQESWYVHPGDVTVIVRHIGYEFFRCDVEDGATCPELVLRRDPVYGATGCTCGALGMS